MFLIKVSNECQAIPFDDLITAPLHGFKGADDYYHAARRPKLKMFVFLCKSYHERRSLMTEAVIPKYTLPSNIDYRLYEQGGHVGFVTGSAIKPRFGLKRHYRLLSKLGTI